MAPQTNAQLACMINDYWFAQGYRNVRAEIVPIDERTPNGGIAHYAAVRSNLINGLPPGPPICNPSRSPLPDDEGMSYMGNSSAMALQHPLAGV